jgi:hypothetical protein
MNLAIGCNVFFAEALTQKIVASVLTTHAKINAKTRAL